MIKYILFIIIPMAFLNASAQPDTANCIAEINETVWKPFVKHLQSGNKKGFSALHSKRISRIQIDNNRIQDYEKYFPLKSRNDTVSLRGNNKLLFELRFDKRFCDGNKAWHSGYYQGRILEQGKQERAYYGRFFVVLEKEQGVWKILVDADTGTEANEANFRKAAPMD